MTVRVRFAPSPTGDLHVGVARTALFNWAYARNRQGTFVLRIEDTDLARSTEESYRGVLDVLRWLGLDWDEGPEVGGGYGPYRQSERMDSYRETLQRLLADGSAYLCYCTPEELAQRREQARAAGGPSGYDGRCRTRTSAEVAAFEAEGRPAVVRFRMPEGSTTFDDLVRGEVTFDHAFVPDFALARSDGAPLYTLTAPMDDMLMQISHVLRGEDLLSSTPRQIQLLLALGLAPEQVPSYGHLPYVMGENNQKLSKRHGEVSVSWFREQGYLPEAMRNYLALLGWSLHPDNEMFTLEEMVAGFDDIRRISKNPARFDHRKLHAINADWIRRLDDADLLARLTEIFEVKGLVGHPPTPEQAALLQGGVPLVQERITTLTEAVEMLRFLFVSESEFMVDPASAARGFGADAPEILQAAGSALAALEEWSAADIERALKESLVDGLGLKPRKAFAPVRVAATGRTVSPPLYESLELLGRGRVLERIAAVRAELAE